MKPNASPAVAVRGVAKTFRSGRETVHALRGVSLDIREGEVFGLLGPNGAGKTTLISVLVGLTKADAGSAHVIGLDVERQRHAVQQRINLVHGFSGVQLNLTALELMRYYADLYNVPQPEARIERLLKLVGVWERRNQFASLYSSGYRQRFFIAKALLNEPHVLFLDEPTVGLDVDMAIQVREVIRRLHREGYTILLTTHDMKEAENLCDRIALIARGRIVAQGTAAELKQLVKKEEAIRVHGTLQPATKRRLQKLAGVLGVATHRSTTRLLVENPRVMTSVLRALADSGDDVDRVHREQPSLEDVFLKLTHQGLENDDGTA